MDTQTVRRARSPCSYRWGYGVEDEIIDKISEPINFWSEFLSNQPDGEEFTSLSEDQVVVAWVSVYTEGTDPALTHTNYQGGGCAAAASIALFWFS